MITVVHYINQFFAGIGGEDKADTPFEVREGAVGPGRALQMFLEDRATITHTLVCGDNHFHDNRESVLEDLREAIETLNPDLLVAGPAFNAGRYSLACGAACALAWETFDVAAVTGMFPNSPGAEVYRDRVVVIPTGDSAAQMEDALKRIARVGLKLAHGEALGPAADEGILPRGFRGNWPVLPIPAVRAVDMLVAKLNGKPVQTEIPLPEAAEIVAPAEAVPSLAGATLALVTEGGLVPEDNPDRIESSSATRWARYPLTELEGDRASRFKSIHAGYDARWVNQDPNRIVPVDAVRALAASGEIGKLHDYFYVTVGTGTSVTNAGRIGSEIAAQLINEGVHAAIVTST
jgi:betaine reductase